MTNLNDLARRVMDLHGPSREVDVEVFKAIGAPVPFQFANKLIALEFNDVEQAYFAKVSDDMQVRYSPSHYTASLDAAMTLVPEGCDRADHIWPNTEGRFCTYLWASLKIVGKSRAATPALALTAAALLARGEQS